VNQSLPITLLEKPSFSDDQLRNSLGQATSQSGAGPQFDFSMRLPQGWAVSFFPETAPAPGAGPVLMMHASPESSREVEIMVWCLVLEREIHPVDGLDAWLKQKELGIVDAKMFRSSYGVLGDALLHSPDKEKVGTHRVLTVKDGNRLFLIEAIAHRDTADVAELMQNLFLVSASTFQLVAPTKERFAEPFDWLTLEGTVPLRTIAPLSWTQHPQSEKPAGGDALLLDNAGAGTILLASMEGCDNSRMLEEVLIGKIEAAAGLEVKGLDDTKLLVPAQMNALARSGMTQKDDVEMNVLLTRAETPDVSAAILLLTPSEGSAPGAFAVNRRAYEVLVETLQPG